MSKKKIAGQLGVSKKRLRMKKQDFKDENIGNLYKQASRTRSSTKKLGAKVFY